MAQRLDEAPLVVHAIVERRLGKLPRTGDGHLPLSLDHRPRLGEASGVGRLQLHELGEEPRPLRRHERRHLDPVQAEPFEITGDIGVGEPRVGDLHTLEVRRVQACVGEIGVLKARARELRAFLV